MSMIVMLLMSSNFEFILMLLYTFQKALAYGMLIGGWTVGVYLFQQLWDNLRPIILLHQSYSFWYTVTVSFISFLVCYKIGPPRNQRSKNIVMWTLQV